MPRLHTPFWRLIQATTLFITTYTSLYSATPSAYSPPIESLNSSEIVVQLETDCQQIPIYLTQPYSDQNTHSPLYLAALDTILRFDFRNSHAYRLMDVQADRESHAKSFFKGPQAELSFWQHQGAQYLVTPLIQEQGIALQVSNLSTLSLHVTPFISLKGSIDEDRNALHRLADTVHEAITGIPGIATTRILYTIKRQKGTSPPTSEVWESDYDGGNARKIITGEDYCLHPVYVPPKSGEKIKTLLYISYSGGQPRLHYASRQEGKGYRVSALKGIQLTPAISWQRDQIAFICDVAGSPDLFLQPFDPLTGKTGPAKRLFHAEGASQSSPSFHPSGSQLTFTSDKNGTPQIYLMSLKQPQLPPQLISRRARNGSASTFSPDGSKIAFSSKTAGVRQIWVYDCVSKEEQQITFSSGDKENPSWAPDSLHIIYNGTSPGDYELYFLDLNKMKPVRIPTQSGEKRFPYWEPRFSSAHSPLNPL